MRFLRSGVFWATNLVWAGILAVVVLSMREGKTEGSDGNTAVAARRGEAVLTEPASSAAADVGAGNARWGGDVGVKAGGGIGGRLAAALGLSDPLARVGKVSEILLGLNAENVGEVLAALEEGPRGGVDDALFREFIGAWAKFDGRAAIEYAQKGDGGRKVRGGDDAAIRAWAGVAPDAAIEFLGTQPKNENTTELHHEIVAALVESDFERAAEFAKANGRSRARGESIDLLARAAFESGGKTGLENWLGGIDIEGENGMDSFKKYAFAEATERIAEKSPDEAEAWLMEHLEGGYVDARAMYSVAGAVGGDDRGERAEWLAELPADGGRNEAIGWAVDRWAREDATAASAWLSGQELGEAYDPAVRALAGRLAGSDPAAAMSWGNAIEGERGRSETLWRIGREWIQKDKVGAATWLSENEVPGRVLEGLARYLK